MRNVIAIKNFDPSLPSGNRKFSIFSLDFGNRLQISVEMILCAQSLVSCSRNLSDTRGAPRSFWHFTPEIDPKIRHISSSLQSHGSKIRSDRQTDGGAPRSFRLFLPCLVVLTLPYRNPGNFRVSQGRGPAPRGRAGPRPCPAQRMPRQLVFPGNFRVSRGRAAALFPDGEQGRGAGPRPCPAALPRGPAPRPCPAAL